MLRFGYHLLFWNAYLQEEATQNPQLVRENPPLYGQIIIFDVTPKVWTIYNP